MIGSKSRSSKFMVKSVTSKNQSAKEEYIKAIIEKTFAKDGGHSILRYLNARLDKSNWMIVLKTLMIFHRCFQEGDPSFMETIKITNHDFSLQKFSLSACPTALGTVFVKQYAKYLEEKVSVVRLLGYQFEINSNAIKDLSKLSKYFEVVPKLQSQLNALLNCKMKPQSFGTEPLILQAYKLMIKDSECLYSLLDQAMSRLLDEFWKANKENTEKILNMYKLFEQETDALVGLYDLGRKFLCTTNEIKRKDSMLTSMENHVKEKQEAPPSPHQNNVQSDDEASDNSGGGGHHRKSRRKSRRKLHKEEIKVSQLKKEEDVEYYVDEEKPGKIHDDVSDEDDGSSDDHSEEPEDRLKHHPNGSPTAPHSPEHGHHPSSSPTSNPFIASPQPFQVVHNPFNNTSLSSSPSPFTIAYSSPHLSNTNSPTVFHRQSFGTDASSLKDSPSTRLSFTDSFSSSSQLNSTSNSRANSSRVSRTSTPHSPVHKVTTISLSSCSSPPTSLASCNVSPSRPSKGSSNPFITDNTPLPPAQTQPQIPDVPFRGGSCMIPANPFLQQTHPLSSPPPPFY